MKPIRVLVIDDSAFMRKIISDILSRDKRIKVIDTAHHGEAGLRKIKQYDPDVVTLDVEMPVMDGITTLKKIMQDCPMPVVMLSSATGEGAKKTVEAISNGAVDFIMKPSGPISLDMEKISREMIQKVVMAAQTGEKKTNQEQRDVLPEVKRPIRKHQRTIIAIGTSTGGPKALQRILTDLPKNRVIPPMLIVQHMPETFTKSLAERLNSLASIHVREAVHGEIIKQNTAYIAPGGLHMKVREIGLSYAVELTDEKPRNGHKPSVDTLFESVGSLEHVDKIFLVLTGMGKDGSHSLSALKTADPNAMVIAESEQSATINGMPKAAIQTGTVSSVIHLNEIGNFIGQQIGREI